MAARRVRAGVERALERRLGVDTAEHVYHEDLGVATENRVWHDPSAWLALRRALRRLTPTEDDVFVDYGSGLGRALLVAAELPFRRIIGVEVSEALNERARANISRKAGRARCNDVELVAADALEWDVPPDVTVAYLYCPFTGDVFDGVLARILASIDEHPRPLRLVYNYPVEHERVLASGRVRLLDAISSVWPPGSLRAPEVILTYLALPCDASLADEYIARFPRRLRRGRHWLGPYRPHFVLEKPARLGGVVLDAESKS